MQLEETSVEITPALKGALVPADLLKTKAIIHFVISASDVEKGGFIFEVRAKDFAFTLGFKNSSIFIQRNEIISTLTLDEFLSQGSKIRIFVVWTPASLALDCGISVDKIKKSVVKTSPIVPPVNLLRWVRKKNLIDTPIYETEEELREKVYSCLETVNDKVREADAYKSFWNISYSGNTITSRLPKKEVELQPLIHCLLSDQMLLSNIEVIPEHKTGKGNIDFSFIGAVAGIGLKKVCVEFKLAHSGDLEHGLLEQLPSYLNVSQSTYGAYCVLDFKGDWFDKPILANDDNLEHFLNKIRLRSKNPAHANIRNFIYRLAKPATASRREAKS